METAREAVDAEPGGLEMSAVRYFVERLMSWRERSSRDLRDPEALCSPGASAKKGSWTRSRRERPDSFLGGKMVRAMISRTTGEALVSAEG